MGNRYLILGVVVLFLFSLFTGYCFGEDAIVVGKLTTDKMVYGVDERITVAYSIENYCNTGWVPVLDAKCPFVFHYEIFNIKTSEQVASGDLIYSQVQYVWKHSTEVFAVGMRRSSPGQNHMPGFAGGIRSRDYGNNKNDLPKVF